MLLSGQVEHIASQPFSVFRRIRKKAPKGTPYPGAPGSGFTFIMNFQAPGYGVAMYFQRKASEKIGDPGGGKAFELSLKSFLEGDEEYRTRHLKFFPVVTEVRCCCARSCQPCPALLLDVVAVPRWTCMLTGDCWNCAYWDLNI